MPAPARVVEHGARERDQICLTAGDDVLSLLGLCNKTDRDCNDTRAAVTQSAPRFFSSLAYSIVCSRFQPP